MGFPFSTGFKSTIDPFLNWQEHVLTLLQVSFDVERATSIRITLTEIENFALAISPGSSSNLVTKGPLLVPSPYLLESCRELWEGTAFNTVDLTVDQPSCALKLCLNHTVQKYSREVPGTSFRFGPTSEILENIQYGGSSVEKTDSQRSRFIAREA